MSTDPGYEQRLFDAERWLAEARKRDHIVPFDSGDLWLLLEHRDVLGLQLAEAWMTLPDSVAGDAAPEGTSLADRIRALTMERDRDHIGFGECHERHMKTRAELDRWRKVIVEYVNQVESGEKFGALVDLVYDESGELR